MNTIPTTSMREITYTFSYVIQKTKWRNLLWYDLIIKTILKKFKKNQNHSKFLYIPTYSSLFMVKDYKVKITKKEKKTDTNIENEYFEIEWDQDYTATVKSIDMIWYLLYTLHACMHICYVLILYHSSHPSYV